MKLASIVLTKRSRFEMFVFLQTVLTARETRHETIGHIASNLTFETPSGTVTS